MIRHFLMALPLTAMLAGGAVAQTMPQHDGAAPKPASIALSVAYAGTLVRTAGGTELRGVVVAIGATVPWHLQLQATAPDSTVSACVREVRGPARAVARDLKLTRAGAAAASGAAGKDIRLTFDYHLPAGVSPATITYVIFPE